MSNSSEQKRICILGLTVSGNRGAESMLLSIMHNMETLVGPCAFDLVSVYAKEDRAQKFPPNLRIVDGSPIVQMLLAMPLSLLLFPFRKLGFVRSLLNKIPVLESILESDLVLDSGGVAFIDGRGVPLLIYNTCIALPPALLGKPVVKLAQAMGPFQNSLNRMLAKFTLTRLSKVVARGAITGSHLKELGLENYEVCADTAFVMPLDEQSRSEAEALLPGDKKDGLWLGISPSTVVDDYCKKSGIDYAQEIAQVIDRVRREGFRVALIPHSVRIGSTKRMNNDLIICREILEHLDNKESVLLIDKELTAPVLRALIGRMDFYIASRFHSMVSALSMKVPTLLIGWSHKYQEVMEMFGMTEWTIPYQELRAPALLEKFEQLRAREVAVRAQFEEHLSQVQQSAKRNFELAAAMVA